MKNFSTIASITDSKIVGKGLFEVNQIGRFYSFILLLLVQMLFIAGNTTEVEAQTLGTGGANHCSTAGADGKIYTWGNNSSGQLGDGTYNGSKTLKDVSDKIGKRIISLANGEKHTLALASDGTVYAWGSGKYGQLGNGTFYNVADSPSGEPTPVLVEGALKGVEVRAIAAGANHSMAIDWDGNVYTWGYGLDGQLGDGIFHKHSPYGVATPIKLEFTPRIRAIAAGRRHSLALDVNNNVYAWGHGREGQLGTSTGLYTNKPILVKGISNVTEIAAGANHSLAIVGDERTVYAWGYNSHGQLGNNSFNNSAVPVQVLFLSGVKAIAGGAWHSLAIGSDDKAYAWGHGAVGQLGDGNYYEMPGWSTPVQVKNLSGVKAVAGGTWHSLAIGSDYLIYAWGDGYHGVLGINHGLGTKNRYSPIPVNVSSIDLGAPSATLSGGGTICAGSSINLSISLTGKAPWTISYSTGEGTTPTTVTVAASDLNSLGIYALNVSPLITSNYSLNSLVDANGNSGHVTGTASVTVKSPSVDFRISGEFTVDVNSAVKTYVLIPENTGEAITDFTGYTWTISEGTITGGSGATTISNTGTIEVTWPSSPNVHTITVVYDNSYCATQSITQYISVYDPNGSVTGGGWINSPKDNSNTYSFMKETGRASFGFVALNKKGGETIGNTEFNFKTGAMNFKSTSYNQDLKLVITDAGKIMYKGWGTINDTGKYEFSLTAYDEQYKNKDNTAIDRLRMQIWDVSSGKLKVYDNMLSEDELADPNELTRIGDGNVVIHRKLTQSGKAALSKLPMQEKALLEQTNSFYNYPNIFSESTTIAFTLVEEQDFLLEVYDLKGALVKKVYAGTAKANLLYEYELNARELADGIYIARLITDFKAYNLKMLLRK